MNYLSVCSGVEAATVAWHDLGWNPVAFSEIEAFPSAVLKYHYPEVPNMGDMTKFEEWSLNGAIDLLVGGTPCQSFSIAGLRKGLEDERGNLALVYCQMLAKYQPKWFIWENVPGVLSSSGGRDFGSFLGAVAELGYGFSYRVLDAQYFGVAQRRRRVFVVGYLGDWRPPFEVLAIPEGLSGHPKPSREKGQEVARCLTTGIGSRYDGETDTFVYENHGTDSRIKQVDVCPTVTARWGTGGNNVPLAHAFKVRGGCDGGGKGYLGSDELSFTLSTTHDQDIYHNSTVRRLSPIECERLQGFPDDYTLIPWRKGQSPDSARYKAMGNSMAVPVMRWLGDRINKYEQGLL